jgi:predicted GIY-YIG superfamily endonuclease
MTDQKQTFASDTKHSKPKKEDKNKLKQWFDVPKSSLYVLQCEEGKFYVGVTDKSAEERFLEHLQMTPTTASWTSKFPPIKILENRPCTSWHDEENTTIDLMSEHGIENVRGGLFSQIVLPIYQKEYLRARLGSIRQTCYLCGSANHLARKCPYNKNNSKSVTHFHPYYGRYRS